MLHTHRILFLILGLLICSDIMSQDKLMENMVADSLVKNLKIKKVTEDWCIGENGGKIANTKFERYDQAGYRSQRVHINYTYDKCVWDYKYKFRKAIVVERGKCYDWNPYREKSGADTIVRQSKKQYRRSTGFRIFKRKPSLAKYKTRVSFDGLGRVKQTVDTVKGGSNIWLNFYDEKGQLFKKEYHISERSYKEFILVDSLFYDINGVLSKMVTYHIEDRNKFITTFEYNRYGLIAEKKVLKIYTSNKRPETTFYRYRYEFYEK